jgi:hypothetical protein
LLASLLAFEAAALPAVVSHRSALEALGASPPSRADTSLIFPNLLVGTFSSFVRTRHVFLVEIS